MKPNTLSPILQIIVPPYLVQKKHPNQLVSAFSGVDCKNLGSNNLFQDGHLT